MGEIQNVIHCMKVIINEAVCEECSYYPQCVNSLKNHMVKVAISAMEELQQYRTIGTPDECREAREKRVPMKPKKDGEQTMRYITIYDCPSCGGLLSGIVSQYCYHCGQAMDWSVEHDT